MNHGCRSDEPVSPSIPLARSGSTSKASTRTLTMDDAAAASILAGSTVLRRSIVTPLGRARAAGSMDADGSVSTITWLEPRSRKPFASSRATRSVGASWSGEAQMCGVRPNDAKSTRASVRRRSKASGSVGQRSPSSRFQNGSCSTWSWSRMASPRSRRSRPGTAWTLASWRSSQCIVAASIMRSGSPRPTARVVIRAR